MQRLLKSKVWLCAVGASLFLGSCAITPPDPVQVPPLVGLPAYHVEDIDFLAVSEPMKHFVEQFAPAKMSTHKKAWNLSYSMLDPALMPFGYDPTTTLSATETFRQKAGNCISFSAMFIAIAREAGLKAWFQEVRVPPQWTNIDETYLVSKHVNAVTEGHDANFVVDVSGTRRGEWLDAKKIPDSEAFAQFYNNYAAEALVRQNLPEAYAYLHKALEIEPGASYVWANLGVVFNRNGQVDDAKFAYQTALSFNPKEATALNNLHQLYFDEGSFALAEETQARVERYQSKNPWHMYHLSNEAIEEYRYTDAVDLIQQAIKLNPKEYRFHYALARTWLLVGDNQAARESLERARRLAPPESEISRISLNQLLLNVDS